MKNVKTVLGIILLLLVVTACSRDSASSDTTMKIVARATYDNTGAGKVSPTGEVINSTVVLTSFKINIREIEFKFAESDDNDDNDDDNGGNDGDDDNDGFYDGDDEVELRGPWELDLLNQTALVTTVTIPNGTYEEVEFKLNRSNVSTSPMFNRTVEIRGTIDGTPFVFWHSFEEDFEIDYEDNAQNLVVSNNSFDLILNIDLNLLMSQVDLSSAVDGDGDGVIEIGPNDTDGNNSLANSINDRIEDCTDMDDDND
ncbi:hypothetical protein [Flavobacterium sp. 25HG05S-40]|uniref:hypothetical protein n=1 Tax=Flavobacterium sp. 25HG05S-40 TaxID=3458682 RepID=UPI004043DC7E